jgi:hypothetical protein
VSHDIARVHPFAIPSENAVMSLCRAVSLPSGCPNAATAVKSLQHQSALNVTSVCLAPFWHRSICAYRLHPAIRDIRNILVGIQPFAAVFPARAFCIIIAAPAPFVKAVQQNLLLFSQIHSGHSSATSLRVIISPLRDGYVLFDHIFSHKS